MTVVFVEHDMDVVYDISDWVVVMGEGRVIAEGTARRDRQQPAGHRRLPRAPPRRAARPRRGGGGSWPRPRRPSRADGAERRRWLSPTTLPAMELEPGRRATTCERPAARGDRHRGRLRARGRTSSTAATSSSTPASSSASSARTAPGKSTLLKALFGLIPVRGGHGRRSRGEDITGRKAHALVALGRRLRARRTTTCSPASPSQENLEMGLYQRPQALRRALRGRVRAVPAARASAASSGPGRCPAASARWWRWVGR